MGPKLITVVETPSYLAAAKGILSEEDRKEIVELVAAEPESGVSIGSGIRKMRIGVDGRGKRGGGRVVFLYAGFDIPVFLLTLFAKNEKSNLSRSEHASLAELATKIVNEYRRKR